MEDITFVLSKYNQVIRVQSSTNVTNQRIPVKVVIGEGPQSLEWIKAKEHHFYSSLLEKIHDDF